MNGYDLGYFVNGKAFIHFDGVIDGKSDYGPRICINNKGEKLFELPDRDMIVNEFEDEDVAFVMGGGKCSGGKGVNDRGKYAVINNKGEFLTEFIYDTIYGGSEEGLFEAKRNGKHGHMDITGREIIPCMYDDGNYFLEGVAAECLNGKWGMVDYFNNTVIPFEYEDIFICKNGIINAKKNGKWGLINKNNEVVVDFLYDEIDSYCTRDCVVFPVLKDNKWGLIDRDNNVIVDFKYEYMEAISDEDNNIGQFISMSVEKDGKRALYSAVENKFLTDFIYNQIGHLSCGRFMIRKDKKVGCIDTYGEVVAPAIYDNTNYNVYSEDVAVMFKDNKAGVIDLSGNLIIPCIYKNIRDCSNGLLLATDLNGNEGYINKKGDVIVPFGKYYLSLFGFNDGLTPVWSKETGNAYINNKGEIVEIKI